MAFQVLENQLESRYSLFDGARVFKLFFVHIEVRFAENILQEVTQFLVL